MSAKWNSVHKVRMNKTVIWTHITGHGWDEHEADLAFENNNTKRYGMTKATLAQYQTCGADDQQGMIDKTESRPPLPHWIHSNDSL